MAEQVLVVQGGKLIDGTGRPPIENSVIVIHAGKFQASAGAANSLFPPALRSLMPRARPFCRGSSMDMATWRIFMASFISIWELPPAPISSSTRTARGPWRKNRAPLWGKSAGRGFGCRAGRSAASAPGTMHLAREPPATTSSSQRRRKCAERCSGKRSFGCDILKVNEFLSLDLVKVAVDEAHRLGMPVAAHSWDVVGHATRASMPSSISGRSATARFLTHLPGASSPRIGSAA